MPDDDALTTDARALDAALAEALDAHRPDAFRYALALCGDPWDAEDLVQDALCRCLRRLGQRWQGPRDWRRYLLRCVGNCWIDAQRHRRVVLAHREAHANETATTEPSDPVAVDEAAAALLSLPPRQAAAVVLVDVFGCTAAEGAAICNASEGSIKMALGRGRRRLARQPGAATECCDPHVLRAFVAAFNRRDLGALAELLDPAAQVACVGVVEETDRAEILAGSLPHTLAEAGEPRAEIVTVRDRPLLLITYLVDGERRIGDVVVVETMAERIVGYRHYYFCPEVLTAVGAALERPVQTHGYRFASLA